MWAGVEPTLDPFGGHLSFGSGVGLNPTIHLTVTFILT